jgi:hypothetical protein
MKRTLPRLAEVAFRDEAAMRAFYQSCGIREQTTEAAIQARRNRPVEEKKSPAVTGRPRKVRP